MIGRGVVIYDSDHHTICNATGEITNPDAPVAIGDHVWLATNATVLKGATIGSGSIISANSVVHGNIPGNCLYRAGNIRENYGSWTREHP
jgi:acetyltransferase-like isoleucine patch superfamily enzyme